MLQIMVTCPLDIEERYKILTEERDKLRRALNDFGKYDDETKIFKRAQI